MNNPKNRQIKTIWYDSQSYKNYIAQLKAEQRKIDEDRKNKPENLIKRIYNKDSGLITPEVFVMELMEKWNKADLGNVPMQYEYTPHIYRTSCFYGDIGPKPVSTIWERPWSGVFRNPKYDGVYSNGIFVENEDNQFLTLQMTLEASVNQGESFIEVSTTGSNSYVTTNDNFIWLIQGQFLNRYPKVTSSKIFNTDIIQTNSPSHIYFSGGGYEGYSEYSYPYLQIRISFYRPGYTYQYIITYTKTETPGISYSDIGDYHFVYDTRQIESLPSSGSITADVYTHITARFPTVDEINYVQFTSKLHKLAASAYGFPGITGGAVAGSFSIDLLDNIGLKKA